MIIPVLDSQLRDEQNMDRTIYAERSIQPLIEDSDTFATIPLRISDHANTGLVLELGPYTLNNDDIQQLRDIIRDYDITKNGPTIRQIK